MLSKIQGGACAVFIALKLPILQLIFRQTMFPNQPFTPYLAQNYLLSTYTPNFFPNYDLFEQINKHILKLHQRQEDLKQEITGLRDRIEGFAQAAALKISEKIGDQYAKHLQNIQKNLEQNSYFKKDHHCAVKGCKRKYSSRIALRAHLRRKHKKEDLQNIEKEP